LGITKTSPPYRMLVNQCLILLISCLETPKARSGTANFGAEPPLASSSAISFPCKPAHPGTQHSPTACLVEIPFNAFRHCWTNGDIVLTALRAFKATWLSDQILTCFSGLHWNWISWAHAKIAYISVWKTVAYLPREKLNRLISRWMRIQLQWWQIWLSANLKNRYKYGKSEWHDEHWLSADYLGQQIKEHQHKEAMKFVQVN